MTKSTQYIGYRITNTINGRYYIGVVREYNWRKKSVAYTHKRHGFMPAKPRGYMGGGQAIREAIIKHGDHSFTREILARFDNFDDADAWERDNVIMQEQDPLSYNLQGGGKAGFKVGKATREKMSKAKKGKTGRSLTDEEKEMGRKRMTGENNPIYGLRGKDNPKYNHDAPRYPCGRIKKTKGG